MPMAFDMFADSDAIPAEKQRARQLTIIAQDPHVTNPDGTIVRAVVSVPPEWIEIGPRGQRFHVVDYDATARRLHEPLDLTDPAEELRPTRAWSSVDQFRDAPDQELIANPKFHQQNVYAIAARTLGAFESALGRRLPWAFDGHQLYLVPHALAEANAHYSGEDEGVFFGYLETGGGPIQTCLSHDIIVHEVTHAVLDGLRPRFIEPSLPDQPAFHEAFADIVALLSVFSVSELVLATLGEGDERGRIPTRSTDPSALRDSPLFTLASQFGEAVSGVRGSALRRSLTLEPGYDWVHDPKFGEAHRRGEVLVAAVLRTLLDMWTGRLADLTDGERLSRARAAEEGAKAAAHLLRMVIRAIDYSPAVELEFGDFLDAVLVSDEVVAPEDNHHYRDSVKKWFNAYGIQQPETNIVDLARQPFNYTHLNFTSLRADRDEVHRFIWQNAGVLGIDRELFLSVDAVRPSVRVGPDGLVVNEVVADYAQSLNTTVAEAHSSLPDLTIPAGLKDDVELQLWGGGTLIFDQFGMAKFHQSKPLANWTRQSSRLDYLASRRYFDSRGRLGFSLGTPQGLRFAAFHEPNSRAGEDW
jgi:hypothetical protein